MSDKDITEKENLSNKFVYLDIKIGNEKAGRVIIKLYNNIAPKTAENFLCLVTGEKGIGKFGKPLHYKNTNFHRVIVVTYNNNE
ncbi:peptidyl-prolyl cis-trans isomerase D, mitochondrial-like isoform X3 [Agrilus planipennis]|uniref:Peptidyl-prolyl cis-trans isomerase D, mitochondrial-like isoform X3 n=1 Tax=Agrilus planipennis TaxID=224129 RepID=A0A7F5R7J5_AGRPL|nr:peptidyl-prolyl cis-trans isomerase D, mitochondrial-like isoform X3 [Agrilus planipennis]